MDFSFWYYLIIIGALVGSFIIGSRLATKREVQHYSRTKVIMIYLLYTGNTSTIVLMRFGASYALLMATLVTLVFWTLYIATRPLRPMPLRPAIKA